MKKDRSPQIFELDAWFHVPGDNDVVLAWTSRP